jgi:hypothetical protein
VDSTGFYTVAAQVIPVLVLILVVEYRLFGGGRQGEPEAWWASGREPGPGERVRTPNALFAALFLILLFVAELLALDAVRTGAGSAAAEWVVSSALLLGLLMVLLVPAEPFLAILLDRTPLYRVRVWAGRRLGWIAADAPDPPRAGEGPPPVPERGERAG